MKNLLKNKVAWVVAIALATLAIVGGVYFVSGGYDSDYTEQPGVVYDNGGDGHSHDHPNYGVIR